MRAPHRCIRRALNQRFEFRAMDADAACSGTHRAFYKAHARGARGSSASPPHWLQPVRRSRLIACFHKPTKRAPSDIQGAWEISRWREHRLGQARVISPGRGVAHRSAPMPLSTLIGSGNNTRGSERPLPGDAVNLAKAGVSLSFRNPKSEIRNGPLGLPIPSQHQNYPAHETYSPEDRR
jgi:hypothetical protein